jgi:hypothetical protein
MQQLQQYDTASHLLPAPPALTKQSQLISFQIVDAQEGKEVVRNLGTQAFAFLESTALAS